MRTLFYFLALQDQAAAVRLPQANSAGELGSWFSRALILRVLFSLLLPFMSNCFTSAMIQNARMAAHHSLDEEIPTYTNLNLAMAHHNGSLLGKWKSKAANGTFCLEPESGTTMSLMDCQFSDSENLVWRSPQENGAGILFWNRNAEINFVSIDSDRFHRFIEHVSHSRAGPEVQIVNVEVPFDLTADRKWFDCSVQPSCRKNISSWSHRESTVTFDCKERDQSPLILCINEGPANRVIEFEFTALSTRSATAFSPGGELKARQQMVYHQPERMQLLRSTGLKWIAQISYPTFEPKQPFHFQLFERTLQFEEQEISSQSIVVLLHSPTSKPFLIRQESLEDSAYEQFLRTRSEGLKITPPMSEKRTVVHVPTLGKTALIVTAIPLAVAGDLVTMPFQIGAAIYLWLVFSTGDGWFRR